MKKIFFAFLVFIIFFSSCATQNNALKKQVVSEMVDAQRFTFVARSVYPTEDARFNPRLMLPNGSNLYNLTSYYDVKVTPDSVTAYLPFFGRAYSAPVNPSEGGIKFTSTDFSYKRTMKKGNVEIEIVPNDNRDVRNLFFSISPDGFSTLRILSVSRTPISYNGELEIADKK